MPDQAEKRLPRAYRDLPPTPVVAKLCVQYDAAARNAARNAGVSVFNPVDVAVLEDLGRLFAKCQIRDGWLEYLQETEK